MDQLRITCFFIFIINLNTILSQCELPMSINCKDATVLCSFEELNGMECRFPSYSIPNNCLFCEPSSQIKSLGWFAFTTDGGNLEINVNTSSCLNMTNKIKIGLLGDCKMNEIEVTNAVCIFPGFYTMHYNLTACKTYYLFLGTCNGAVCNFTINTSDGARPKLDPLEKINSDTDRRIMVKKGSKNSYFNITGQKGNCEPLYTWSLDGITLLGNVDNIDLDFPNEGDFQLCVTALIGNLDSDSFCDQTGPECATIVVR